MLVRYEHSGERLVVSGDTALQQSELGLKPFSAMLGALQVQDEMRVQLPHSSRTRAPPTGLRAPAGRRRPPGRPSMGRYLAPSSPSSSWALYTLRRRLEHDLRIHGDGAVDLRIEPEVAGDGVDVAVEHQPHDLALRVDERAAGVAADDVVVGREVEARLQVEVSASPSAR